MTFVYYKINYSLDFIEAAALFYKHLIHKSSRAYFIVDGDYSNCPSNTSNGCSAWSGLNELNIEGQYVWDHSNTPMTFSTWYSFKPELGDIRDCVSIQRKGQWNDKKCTALLTFICEKEISNL